MGWKVNNLLLRGRLEGILESIGEICNINGEGVGISNEKTIWSGGAVSNGEENW